MLLVDAGLPCPILIFCKNLGVLDPVVQRATSSKETTKIDQTLEILKNLKHQLIFAIQLQEP